MTLDDLQLALGYQFKNPSLLVLALTHSSWANEHPDTTAHNERLEFLGDAVLEIVISEQLFSRFPEAREGDLTRLRSSLVNANILADVARGLHLNKLLRLAKGEENQGGRERDALLADAMEAVFGGVFLDGGFAQAQVVIARLYEKLWPEHVSSLRQKDFKTQLQEATQRLSKGLPVYTLEDTQGPEHAKVFFVRVDLPDGRQFRAHAAGLKRAEQEAAKNALTTLEETDGKKSPTETAHHSRALLKKHAASM